MEKCGRENCLSLQRSSEITAYVIGTMNDTYPLRLCENYFEWVCVTQRRFIRSNIYFL